MSTTQAMPAAAAPERLTWEQICARHPDEWVVLIHLDIVEGQSEPIRSAVVLDHGPSRGTAFRRSMSQLPENECFVHRYTGKSPGPIAPRLLFL